MKKINIRKYLIVIMLITIIILSIGFITVSIKYHNIKTKDNSFNIEFTKIKKTTSTRGSSKEPKGQIDIIKNAKELKMDFNLYSPKDEMSYELTIKNTGSTNVEITDLLMSPDYISDYKKMISPVKITLTDINGKVLEPGEDTVVKLKISYDGTENKGERTIKGKIGIISSKQ